MLIINIIFLVVLVYIFNTNKISWNKLMKEVEKRNGIINQLLKRLKDEGVDYGIDMEFKDEIDAGNISFQNHGIKAKDLIKYHELIFKDSGIKIDEIDMKKVNDVLRCDMSTYIPESQRDTKFDYVKEVEEDSIDIICI